MPDFPLRCAQGRRTAPKIWRYQFKNEPRSGRKPDKRYRDMESVKDVSKAFRQARIVGEKLLEQGKINWESYAAMMIGFEEKLKSLGEVI